MLWHNELFFVLSIFSDVLFFLVTNEHFALCFHRTISSEDKTSFWSQLAHSLQRVQSGLLIPGVYWHWTLSAVVATLLHRCNVRPFCNCLQAREYLEERNVRSERNLFNPLNTKITVTTHNVTNVPPFMLGFLQSSLDTGRSLLLAPTTAAQSIHFYLYLL